MATTLGISGSVVTLAEPSYEPDGCVRTVVDIGAIHELLNGGLGYDYVGDRYHWSLRWRSITGAERAAILTQYRIKAEQLFSPPDRADVFTVLVMPNTWRETYWENASGTKYWDCEMELEETSV